MINVFKLASRLLGKAKVTIEYSSTLNKLRAEHPTCRIMTVALKDANIGKNVAILSQSYLDKVSIDSFSYVSNNSKLTNTEIGKFSSIGPHVLIGLSPHPSKTFVSTYPAFYTDKNYGCLLSFRDDKIFDDSIPKTNIGSDVWIGANVVIPGGVSVGTGAIIAAGAVVVKDVPPYAVVGGNPAKVIRYRFSEEQIKLLLESEWWNWPLEKIKQHIDDFSDIENFSLSLRKLAQARTKSRV